MGVSSFILVTLFISDEYSFDKYHKNADHIYRVVLDFNSDGTVTNWAKTSAPIGKYLTGAFPEIEQVVRIRKNPGTDLLTYNDIQFYEEKLFFADSTLFKVFEFSLVRGNPLKALSSKNSIVISEQLAQKYFNNEDPVGKSIRFNNQVDLNITGIIKDIPSNSHFVADAFISFSSLDDLLGEKRLNHWGQFDHYTYVQLNKDASPKEVEKKLPELLKTNAPEWVSEKESLFLQPLTDIHLHSDRKDEITINSKESYSYILGTIAVIVLTMACSNFVNLTTATQLSRTKETAIQKILGADRTQLAIYSLLESLIICFIAALTGFIAAYFALPTFNLITGKQISFINIGWLISLTLILSVGIGLLTSIFPSIQALQTNILQVTRTGNERIQKSTFRTVLIVFQFSTSILLILCTMVVSSQFTFLKTMQIGFNGENIIMIPIKDREKNDKYETIVNELNQLPGVQGVTFSSSTPACNNSLTYTYSFVGTEIKDRSMSTFLFDENSLDVFGMKLKNGRMLNSVSQDTLSEILLNEAAVKQLHLSEPIGQLVTGKVKGKVVGIVENFNHTTLHSEIEPIIMYAYSPTYRFISVKLNDNDKNIGLSSLQKIWPKLYDGYPLEYKYLESEIQQLYSSELKLGQAYKLFSIIALVISAIGLIGLTTFSLRRKYKEISIRKVFGSSTGQLISHLYSNYARIVLVAISISWTLGYYWMNHWLTSFSYKIELTIYHFIIPAVITIIILLITTGIQTLKASLTNPIDNLRDE